MPTPARSLTQYRQTYTQLMEVRRELNELRQAQADADRRTEMLTFQAEEIEAAKLKPGEEPDLDRSVIAWPMPRRWLSTRRKRFRCLDEGSAEAAAATDLVGQAARSLAGLAKIDHAQQELADQACHSWKTHWPTSSAACALPG